MLRWSGERGRSAPDGALFQLGRNLNLAGLRGPALRRYVEGGEIDWRPEQIKAMRTMAYSTALASSDIATISA